MTDTEPYTPSLDDFQEHLRKLNAGGWHRESIPGRNAHAEVDQFIQAVRTDEREKAARIAESRRSGNYDRPEDWTDLAQGTNNACDDIAARIRAGEEQS